MYLVLTVEIFNLTRETLTPLYRGIQRLDRIGMELMDH